VSPSLLRLTLACCAVAAACSAPEGRSTPLPTPRAASAVQPLPIPSVAGNGPALKGAWCGAAGSTCANNDAGLGPKDKAAALLDAYNALSIPATPYTQLTVPSFSLAQPIDWSNGALSNGNFGTNLSPSKLFPNANSRNYAVRFAGYLKIPPSADGLPITRTFALSSDDGASFAISDGVAVQLTECKVARGMGVACFDNGQLFNTVKKVVFPATGGLFPFDALWFQGRAGAGLELSWADGDQTGSPPGVLGAGPFKLVPAESMYSPDVRAQLFLQPGTPAVQAGSALPYQVVVQNAGTVPLSTWTFSVQLDGARFSALAQGAGGAAFPGTCSVSGLLLACAATQTLQPGAQVTFGFTGTVQQAATAGRTIDVQGVVTGLATAPEVSFAVGGQNEIAAGQIFSLTDDPYIATGSDFEKQDTGNTPQGFAATASAGTAEDDPTRVAIGATPPSPPTPTDPPDPSVSDKLLAVAGTSGLPKGTLIDVRVSGPTSPAGCTATADGNGNWTCPAVALSDGSYSATAAIIDASGLRGPFSAPRTFQVVPPAAPALDAPVDGSTINSALVLFLGRSGEPDGQTVRVTVTQAGAASRTCAAVVTGGNWSCSLALPDGVYGATAAVIEVTQALGLSSAAVSFTVATGSACGSTLAQTASPTNQSTPTFTGAAAAGALVSVCESATGCSAAATLLCPVVTVPASGVWTCTAQGALPDGVHTVIAVAKTGGGVQVCPSNTDVFTIDTVAPPPPGFDPPSPSRQPVFTGTGVAGNRIEVRDGPGGALLCSATVDAQGKWTCASAPLGQGSYTLQAVQIDPASNASAPATQPFVVPSAPTLDQPASPTKNPLVTLTGLADQGATVRVTESAGAVLCQGVLVPAGGRFTCVTTALTDGRYSAAAIAKSPTGVDSAPSAAVVFVVDTQAPAPPVLDPAPSPTALHLPLFTGSAEPASQVSIFEGATLLCTSTGPQVSCASTVPLANGLHSVQAQATDVAGNTSALSQPVAFTVDDTSAPAPTLDPLADVPGADPGVTPEPRPTFTGRGVPGDSVTARLVPSGNLCTATVTATGAWTCRSDVTLSGTPPVLYTVDAVQRAASQNAISPPSAPITFTVDTHVPSAPTLDAPISPTSDRRPRFTGTAEPLTFVEVDRGGLAGDVPVCSTTAGSGGAYSCQPTLDLADGTYTLTAKARSRSGNLGPDSTPARTLVVEAVVPPPGAPVIDTPKEGAEISLFANGTSTADGVRLATVLIAGNAAPGTQITLRITGRAAQVLSSATAASGRWSSGAEVALPAGSYSVTATALGQSGSESAASAAVSFSVLQSGSVRGGCQSGGVPWLGLLPVLLFFRRRRAASPQARAPRLAALAGLLLLAFCALPAAAGQLDLGRFRPALGADGLAATEGARPALEGEPRLSAQLWFDGAWEPLVFLPSGGGRVVLVQSRAAAVASLEARVAGALSLGLQAPLLLGQSGDLSSLPSSTRPAQSLSGGVGDLRLSARYGLLRQESAPLDLAVLAAVSLPTASASSLYGDGSAQGELLVAAGRRIALLLFDVDLLGNAVLRLRKDGQVGDVNTGSEVGLRGGAAWIPPGQPGALRRLFLEAEALGYLRSGFSSGSLPAEWRAGLSLCAGPVSLELAAGSALGSGVGAPRGRVVFGAGWSPAACAQPERLHLTSRGNPAGTPGAAAPAAAAGAPASVAVVAPMVVTQGPPLTLPAAAPSTAGTADRSSASDAKPPAGEPRPDAVASLPPPGESAPGALAMSAPPLIASPPPEPDAPLVTAPLLSASGDLSLDELPAPPLLMPEAGASAAESRPGDFDGDGVPDDADSCPTEKGPAKNRGCPAKSAMRVTIRGDRLDLQGHLDFKEGAALDPHALPLLAQVAQVLRSHPELKLEVQAHTDNSLGEEPSRVLSQARADAIVDQLFKDGVERTQLSAKGYGADRPIAPNVNQRGRQRNVRVELKILERTAPWSPPPRS
jgi:flagellar motor protein MotB